MKLLAAVLAATALRVCAQDSGGPVPGLPVVTPEAVGFSSQRLHRLDALMQEMVDEKQFAGIITIAARHGKLFQYRTYGQRDIASGAPMGKDTIFRVYSMSKPITGVAMMILYEEGKWSPQDPISKYIPEFASLKVFKGLDGAGNVLVEDPDHPPTMRELMSFSAGFSYGAGNSPVDRLYRDEKGRNVVTRAGSLQEMIDRLSKIPLLYQPGKGWAYSVSADIQGYIIEKLTGKTFPEFAKERIFDPLGMKDTGFYVPKEKWDRFAIDYMRNEKGGLDVASDDVRGILGYDKMPTMPSGGGGVVSTASDYLRLAQALLNGGELNGVRILGPSSVKLMSSNHLAPPLMNGDWGANMVPIHRIRPGFGFGYDCGVFTDPGLADEPVAKGTFIWAGTAGTWFWVDPVNDFVFVGMVQREGPGYRPNLEELARQTTYQALVRPDL